MEILAEEIERLKQAVKIGVQNFDSHINTLEPAIRYMHYGRDLRMEIANAIEREFPGALQQTEQQPNSYYLLRFLFL